MGRRGQAATMPWGMADPSHLVVARVHSAAARRSDLIAAAEELAASARKQQGCLGFDVLGSPAAADSELVLLSAWRSERDMRAHFASEPYGRYVTAVTDLLARPSDVTIHTVAGTVHPIADLSTEPQRAD
jgi:quinol monooxygenase YgiN